MIRFISSSLLPSSTGRALRRWAATTTPPPPTKLTTTTATTAAATTTTTTSSTPTLAIPATDDIVKREPGTITKVAPIAAAKVGERIYEPSVTPDAEFVPKHVTEYNSLVERFGPSFQHQLKGHTFVEEKHSQHRTFLTVNDSRPSQSAMVFVAPDAVLAGKVFLCHGASIWYGCTLHADEHAIWIGETTNIQDNTSISADDDDPAFVAKAKSLETRICERVTVGHSCVLKSCTIHGEVLIGMGSVVLGGAIIHHHSIVAAGSVVARNTVIPSGQLWAGAPAKFIRDVTHDELLYFNTSAKSYADLAEKHKDEYYLVEPIGVDK